MKKYISAVILAFALVVVSPQITFGQWDYGQNAIDNIIESRIDRRETAAGIKARKSARRTASRRRSSATTPTRTSARPILQNLSFYRDTFQNFHLDDTNGYQVNFSFTDAGSGKIILKSHKFTYYESVAGFDGVPAGIYTVKAEALYNGRKYAVYLGSEDGSPTDPNGGNFAASIKIEIKRGVDDFGTPVLKTFPDTLHVRVIE